MIYNESQRDTTLTHSNFQITLIYNEYEHNFDILSIKTLL